MFMFHESSVWCRFFFVFNVIIVLFCIFIIFLCHAGQEMWVSGDCVLRQRLRFLFYWVATTTQQKQNETKKIFVCGFSVSVWGLFIKKTNGSHQAILYFVEWECWANSMYKHKWYGMMMSYDLFLQWIKSHPVRPWQSIWRDERSMKSLENKKRRKAPTEKNRWNKSIYGTHHFRRQLGDSYILLYYINYVWSFWQTLALLNCFKTKLSSAITEAPEEDVEDLEEDDDRGWWVSLTPLKIWVFCFLFSLFPFVVIYHYGIKTFSSF